MQQQLRFHRTSNIFFVCYHNFFTDNFVFKIGKNEKSVYIVFKKCLNKKCLNKKSKYIAKFYLEKTLIAVYD